MARKRNHGGTREGAGRPKSERDDASVKIDREILAKLQYLAKLERVPTAAFLTEMVRPNVERMFEKATRAKSTPKDKGADA